MKIGVIIQARMSSKRFPGKVLYNIAGKPLLQYMLERIARCDSPDVVMIATSLEETDSPIENFCRANGVLCFRGPLQNVAERFIQIIDKYNLDGFARICGDSPLLDHRIIDQAINIFREGESEMVTNVLPRSYPIGQSVEVLNTPIYKTAYRLMNRQGDLEHVTPYFHRNQKKFKIRNFKSPADYSKIRLCIDTPQDMKTITAIVELMDKPHWEYDLAEILQLYHQVSESIRLNQQL